MIEYQVEHHGIIPSKPHSPPSHLRTAYHLQSVLPHNSLSSDPGNRGGIYVSVRVDGTLCSSWFVWGVILVGQRKGAAWCPPWSLSIQTARSQSGAALAENYGFSGIHNLGYSLGLHRNRIKS